MDEKHEDKRHYRKGIGADLILPLMAAAYAVYYLYTVADFPWEAQMMGTFIAIAIWLLVGLMVVRTALKVWRGDATLRATGLTRPQSKLLLRSAFIGLTALRSEEHTSELQSLMRTSSAVFCLKKQKQN